MNKEELIRKFTSRKFIIAAISAITGVIALLVGDNAAVQTIAGALMIVVPAVVYCVTEGRVDAASAAAITSAVTDAAEKLGADEKTVQTIGKLGDAAQVLLTDTQQLDSDT